MENDALVALFKERYGEGEVRLFSAAGRVNLIGEHIDYCGGPVFPAALNLACTVAARKTNTNRIRMFATTIDYTADLDVTKLSDYKELPWGSYQAGVAYVMQQQGFDVRGCDLLYHATVPFGSGLSSSASIEVATAKMLSTFSKEYGGKEASLVDLAVLSQKAENEYNGVACGIMDQFASSLGKKDNAILLDCATLQYEYVPLQLGECALVIANSNKRRSLQEGKYNERRAECEQALAALQKVLPDVRCLADVTTKDFEQHAHVLSGKIADRARHVVYECDRVHRAAAAVRSGDMAAFGKLLNESHFSLKNLYEVTGKELDALSECARNFDGCLGSRMTGAGFGGCTVSLVKKDCVDEFIAVVGKNYREIVGYEASFYKTSIEDGAKEITL